MSPLVAGVSDSRVTETPRANTFTGQMALAADDKMLSRIRRVNQARDQAVVVLQVQHSGAVRDSRESVRPECVGGLKSDSLLAGDDWNEYGTNAGIRAGLLSTVGYAGSKSLMN